MLRKTSPSTSRIAGGANFWPTWPHSTRKALLRRSAGFAKKLAVKTSNQNRKITQSSCLSAFDGCSARPSRQGPACGKPVEYGCAQGLFCSGCFTKHVERAKKCLITHTNKVSELVAARKTKSEHVVSTRKAVKRENEPIAGAKEEPPRKRSKRDQPDRRPDRKEETPLAVVTFPPKQSSLSVCFASLDAALLPLGSQPKDEEFKCSVMRELVGSEGLQADDFRVLKL